MSNESTGPTAGSQGGTGSGPQMTKNNPFAGMVESSADAPTQVSTPSAPTSPSPAPTPQAPAPPPPAHLDQLYRQNSPAPGTVPPPQQQQQAPGLQAPTEVPPGTSQLTLSSEAADRLAQSLAAGLAQAQQHQQQQVAAQQQQERGEFDGMSTEQLEQHFGVVRANEEQISTIFRGGPEAVQTLNTLLHGVASMGAKIAVYNANKLVQNALRDIRSELSRDYAPAREFAQRAEVERHTQTFYQKFPELNKPEYNETLTTVYNYLRTSGFQGSPEEVYQKVADEAKRLITGILPNAFTTGASHMTTQPGQQQRSSMATMPSPGGGGSNAAGSQSAGSKTTAERLFG